MNDIFIPNTSNLDFSLEKEDPHFYISNAIHKLGHTREFI